MLNSLNYSTQSEKDMEKKSVKYAYELRDQAITYTCY